MRHAGRRRLWFGAAIVVGLMAAAVALAAGLLILAGLTNKG